MAEGLELEFSETNKHIGVIIAVMAAVLALTEAAARNAQVDTVRDTIEASDTWAFYQAKNIRANTLRVSADELEIAAMGLKAGAETTAITKKIEEWRANVKRYESDPEKGEGMKELTEKAHGIVEHREDRQAVGENYEHASAALQLGILLASAAVVTGLVWIAYIGAGLGVIGVIFAVLAMVAPHLLG